MEHIEEDVKVFENYHASMKEWRYVARFQLHQTKVEVDWMSTMKARYTAL